MELELIKLVLALQVFLSEPTSALEYEKPGYQRDVVFRATAAESLTVHDWAADLAVRQACDAGLVLLRHDRHDRIGEAFANGGAEWLIEIRFSDHAEYWQAWDQLVEPRPEQGPIWERSFSLVGSRDRIPSDVPSVETAMSALATALASIIAYAESDGHEHWANNFFSPALAILEGGPLRDSHPHLHAINQLPASDKAIRTIHSASQAWVFGGMGSWNDLDVSDELAQDYEETSSALYSAIQDAMLAVANEGNRSECLSAATP